MKRRSFLQFALAALAALPARAAGLKAHYTERLDGETLVVELEVENLGTAPVDILLWIGARPAIDIAAPALVALPAEPDERPLTRAGPRHYWRRLEPGARLPAGSYRFRRPLTLQRLEFTARVQTPQGWVKL